LRQVDSEEKIDIIIVQDRFIKTFHPWIGTRFKKSEE
jgi:hypothetical protein